MYIIVLFLLLVLLSTILTLIIFSMSWTTVVPRQEIMKDFSYKHWMADHYEEIKDKKLTDLYLIGSHNSAAYEFDYGVDIDSEYTSIRPVVNNYNPLKKFITAWSQNQGMNIYEQLATGVRILYLDTKLNSDGICDNEHSFVNGISSKAADDIVRFLKENPKEIIIVYFGISDEQCIDEYATSFKDFPLKVYRGETVDQLLTSNNRLILNYNGDLLPKIVWYDVDTVDKLDIKNTDKDKSKYSFQTITPSFGTFILSNDASGLYDSVNDIQNKYKNNTNIVYGLFDYVNFDLVKIAVNRNLISSSSSSSGSSSDYIYFVKNNSEKTLSIVNCVFTAVLLAAIILYLFVKYIQYKNSQVDYI